MAALAALDGGFFRGGFLSVQYSQDLRGGGVAALHASRPSLFAASRDSSWNSRTWDNYAAVDNVTSDGILQMSNKTEAEEFLSLSRLSESKSASFSYAQSNHQDVADALPAAAGEVNSPRVELSISDEDAGSVISLESTSASSILSTLDTDDSRFRDTQHTDWLKSSDRAESKTALNIDVAWLKSSEVHQQESEEKLGINSQHFQGHSGFSTLAPGLVAPTLQYSDSECIFESFLSFDPTDLEDSNPFDNNEINQADFEPLVIDLADAEISDVKCAITGTSMSAAQYGQYLNMVNAYFSETAFANSGGQNAGGRFSECLTASSTAASFPDLRDNLIGLSLKHDTPEFVPKSQQKSDADNGSVVSGGYVKRVTKSTDPEDMSEGGEYDEMGSLGAKGEYSIHSGQFEADIRNIFVGNIGRLMSDGVHQLKSYFSALNIIVLKVDIKISFAFLEVKNTPMLQSQIDAIALGSGGKPPPFGKDERMLRIEFVQQSSAGKRSIR